MTVPAVRVATDFDGDGLKLFRWDLKAASTLGDKILLAGARRCTVFVSNVDGTGSLSVELSPDPGGEVWGVGHDPTGQLLVGLRGGSVMTVADGALWLRPSSGRGIASARVWALVQP